MGSLRIIPGTVTGRSLRALILGVEAGASNIQLRVMGSGEPVPVAVRNLQPSPELGRQLNARGVRLKVAEASGLAPGTRYSIIAASTEAQTVAVTVETLPERLPAVGVTIAVASCFYDHFGADLGYLAALKGARWFTPPAMKWLVGDNVYLDVAPDQSRYRDGHEETAIRYVRAFCQSKYADVLSHLPTSVTWDDHELWNNYPESQVHLLRTRPPLREGYAAAAQEALDLFQVPLNPPPVVPGGRSFASRVGEVGVFFADLRTRRTPVRSRAPMLMPEAELDALCAWARGLEGPGVLVVGQPLWGQAGSAFTDVGPPAYRAQYARIWRALAEARYDMLLVAGDVHHSRLLEFDLGNDRKVHEFVSSPACHIPSTASIALNSYKGQGKGAIRFPDRIELDERAAGCRPRLGRYHFGADVQQTIGLLHLAPAAAAGEIEVSAAFIDSVAGVAAEARPSGSSAPAAGRLRCIGQRLFTLRRRAP
ncbi:MAG TPA: hypothetical protein VLS89_16335 [Candidatus Nanopelagicales bacterium]|nr:hypothetical protein [Candidatus Nanopelagicales bacterium]